MDVLLAYLPAGPPGRLVDLGVKIAASTVRLSNQQKVFYHTETNSGKVGNERLDGRNGHNTKTGDEAYGLSR